MDSDSGDELGLGDLMPREPSPPPPEATVSTYTLPEGYGPDELQIRLVGSHPLWGHHLWNTARVTTSYILSHPSLSRNKRVLELGAGGGLPSLGCALAGGRTVLITDYADAALVENIAHNVAANLGDSEEGRAVAVLGHVWGHDVAPLLECKSRAEAAADADLAPNPPTAGTSTGTSAVSSGAPQPNFDLVILSDLMFNHSQHAALLRTLEGTLRRAPGPAFVEGRTPCALVFFTHHRPRLAREDMQFVADLRAAGWACDRVVEEYTGAMFENDPGDERVRGTVHGFRCWRSSVPQAKPAPEAAAEPELKAEEAKGEERGEEDRGEDAA